MFHIKIKSGIFVKLIYYSIQEIKNENIMPRYNRNNNRFNRYQHNRPSVDSQITIIKMFTIRVGSYIIYEHISKESTSMN